MRASCSTESLKKPDPEFSVAVLAARLRDGLHVPPNAALAVAYSGGLDSTVLLHALAALRHDYPLVLSAIHIDHGLHPDSAQWAEHCAAFCRALQVPLQTRRIQVDRKQGDGLEAAARRARYAAMSAVLPAGSTLVTAHHADDQAETVLLQLLRGAGVAGLAGISEKRQRGALTLLRPLLDVSRAALESYAQTHDLHWINDPSNVNEQLRRNFLRHGILPRLEQRWPGVRQNLTRAAQQAAEAQELLNGVAQRDLAVCQAGSGLSVVSLTGLSAARQRNLLRYWLRGMNYSMPDRRKLEEIQALIFHATHSRHACVRIGPYEVWRYRETLMAVPSLPAPEAVLDVEWDLSVAVEIEGVGRLHSEPATGKGVAIARLRSPLRIRMRRGGEVLQLPGRSHHHQLKKLLQEAGVPPWERARMPLLFQGRELAAVADRWVCRDFAAAGQEPGLRIIWTPFPDHPNRS
jgi:tRNA(Ile)-lysidine synthase